MVGGDAPVEHPCATLLVFEDSFEQVVELEHLNIALAHLAAKAEVFLLRVLDPNHVIEQKPAGCLG